jgi:hypothetical protein
LLDAALQAQALLAVALELGAEGLGRGDVLDGEADQPVEGLQQIDVHLAAFVRTGPLDLVSKGTGLLSRANSAQFHDSVFTLCRLRRGSGMIRP